MTFAPNDVSETVVVQTNDDAADEPDGETFNVTLSNATGNATIADGTGVGTINDNDEPTPVDDPPTANAGADQTVDEGATVTLDGSASSDPDGETLTYAWTQTGGPAVTLTGADTATPSFTAPAVDADTPLTFSLEVCDEADPTSLCATDTVTVTVQDIDVPPVDSPPTANAGADQTVDEGDTVTLDGSASSDPDGETPHLRLDPDRWAGGHADRRGHRDAVVHGAAGGRGHAADLRAGGLRRGRPDIALRHRHRDGHGAGRGGGRG